MTDDPKRMIGAVTIRRAGRADARLVLNQVINDNKGNFFKLVGIQSGPVENLVQGRLAFERCSAIGAPVREERGRRMYVEYPGARTKTGKMSQRYPKRGIIWNGDAVLGMDLFDAVPDRWKLIARLQLECASGTLTMSFDS